MAICKIKWGVFALLLLCVPAHAQQRYYGSDGSYQGKRDRNGNFYDNTGAYKGRVTSDGRYYDQYGVYRGKRSR